MTYRDRREARAERLREWAGKREARAAAEHERARQMRDAIPMGQPILVGHHSERADRNYRDRAWNTLGRAVENDRMASAMRSKADGIDAAAAVAIYSDDPDAVEALRAKLERLEADRARVKSYNAACRKAGACTAEALALLTDAEREQLASLARHSSWQLGKHGEFPAYHLANLGGVITKTRQRLARLEAGQA